MPILFPIFHLHIQGKDTVISTKSPSSTTVSTTKATIAEGVLKPTPRPFFLTKRQESKEKMTENLTNSSHLSKNSTKISPGSVTESADSTKTTLTIKTVGFTLCKWLFNFYSSLFFGQNEKFQKWKRREKSRVVRQLVKCQKGFFKQISQRNRLNNCP